MSDLVSKSWSGITPDDLNNWLLGAKSDTVTMTGDEGGPKFGTVSGSAFGGLVHWSFDYTYDPATGIATVTPAGHATEIFKEITRQLGRPPMETTSAA